MGEYIPTANRQELPRLPFSASDKAPTRKFCSSPSLAFDTSHTYIPSSIAPTSDKTATMRFFSKIVLGLRIASAIAAPSTPPSESKGEVDVEKPFTFSKV
ncbi:hypothetical protein KC325_g23 [Hortaea werneckii]|nr:hypothetical protein KC325_g23 [Hortaea werneckii]